MTERSLLTIGTWAENVAQTFSLFLDHETTLGSVSCNVTSPFELKARFKGGGLHLLLTLSNGLSGAALLSLDAESAGRLFPSTEEGESIDRGALSSAFGELAGLLSGTLSMTMGLPVPVTPDADLREKPANLESPLLASFEVPLSIEELGAATLLLTLPASLCEALSTAGEAAQEEAAPAAVTPASAATSPGVAPQRSGETSTGPTRLLASQREPSPELGILSNIGVEVKVVLGRAVLCMEDLLALSEGSLIELDKLADDPVDLFVRDRKIANGDVVVIDERFGVKIRNTMLASSRPVSSVPSLAAQR